MDLLLVEYKKNIRNCIIFIVLITISAILFCCLAKVSTLYWVLTNAFALVGLVPNIIMLCFNIKQYKLCKLRKAALEKENTNVFKEQTDKSNTQE